MWIKDWGLLDVLRTLLPALVLEERLKHFEQDELIVMLFAYQVFLIGLITFRVTARSAFIAFFVFSVRILNG